MSTRAPARRSRSLREHGPRVAVRSSRPRALASDPGIGGDPGAAAWETFRALDLAASRAPAEYDSADTLRRRREALSVVPLLVAALGSVARTAQVLRVRERDVYRWKRAALAMLAGLSWKGWETYARPPARGEGRALCLRSPSARARIIACRRVLVEGRAA